jgi:DNA polymerase-1
MKTKTTKKVKEGKKKLILLDAHAIIHRAYHALPEFATASGQPTGALYGLSTMLIKMIGDLEPDYIVACFDLAGPTYRHEAYDQYKSGRAKTDDNLISQLEGAKEVFKSFGIQIYSCPGFEADDVIGTITEDLKGDKSIDIVIVSGDMDTMQLVDNKRVQVYTMKKGISDTILYDEEKMIERFGFKPELLPDYKGLRGDPSDNIIGVKGVGEKTATSLITTFGSVEKIYKALKKGDEYKKAGITERVKNLLLENEEEALFSKTLASIRTDAPINFTLPQTWRETLVLENVLELFTKLEFRTLGDRVKRLLANNSQPTTNKEQEPTSTYELSGNEEGVKELCLALWVIDSNLTNPNIEEVMRFTKAKSVEEAKQIVDQELDKRSVRKVFEDIEKPLIPIVEEMNRVGIKVDKEFLKGLSQSYHKELSRLEQEIWQEAGEEFNINSPKILGSIIFEKLGLRDKRQKKTPGGALSTKESELEKLRDKSPIIGHVLEYRELQKLLSTYIDAIPPQLDADSRLHSTFSQSATTTGRMGSTNPNLQNIPVRTELGRAIRNAFIAAEGFKFVAIDYSQIELRIAAILSQDEKLVEIFKNGEDVHKGVAARVFKVSPDEVDIAMRSKAKTINFGILYGMGVNALKANLGTDRKEAQEFYNEYFQTFTGLAEYLDNVKSEAQRKGYTETMFGRKRYFSGFQSSLPYVRAQAERMAINAPIQGTEADIVKLSMIRVDEYIRAKGWQGDVRLLLNVHDEIIYEVKSDMAEEAAKKFKDIMERIIPDDQRCGVPIVADIHIGNNWGELK